VGQRVLSPVRFNDHKIFWFEQSSKNGNGRGMSQRNPLTGIMSVKMIKTRAGKASKQSKEKKTAMPSP
jgi:hypothetical protein